MELLTFLVINHVVHIDESTLILIAEVLVIDPSLKRRIVSEFVDLNDWLIESNAAARLRPLPWLGIGTVQPQERL